MPIHDHAIYHAVIHGRYAANAVARGNVAAVATRTYRGHACAVRRVSERIGSSNAASTRAKPCQIRIQPKAPGAGSDDAGSLHLGFRGSSVYNGWWGASVGRDSQIAYIGQPGEWHHIAWRFTGAAGPGNQDIFEDGVLYNSSPTTSYYGGILQENNNVPNAPTVLLIGRTVSNNGAFNGSLSDVRVYNTALTDDDVAAIAATPP